MGICPGQDSRFWRPGDIFDVPCPRCREVVEFFKDEPERTCKRCGFRFKNPRLDLGCLEWCPNAEICREVLGNWAEREGGDTPGA